MAISTSIPIQSQGQFSTDGKGAYKLFPKPGMSISHVLDIVDQPVTIIGSGFPSGVAARVQVSPDRVNWADWLVHGQPVALSANNPMQWLNYTGHFRLRLVDAVGVIYTGLAQPTVVYYASTTTHERNWPLTPSVAGVGNGVITSTVVETRNNIGVLEFRVLVNGVASEWTPFPAGISVPPGAPVAGFTYSGSIVEDVAYPFTDTSTNTPTSWAWTTSTGQSSALQNPTFTFADPGIVTVTLIASNASGSSAPTSAQITVQAGGGGGATNRLVDHLGNLMVDHLGNYISWS